MRETTAHLYDYDIVVVGAGFSGSVIGLKAAELGLNVKAFDKRPEYPDLFRAEKLETDQHQALEKLGLIDLVCPADFSYIDHVRELVANKQSLVPCSKHRGMHYQDTVNAFRNTLSNRGLLEIRKVSQLRDTKDYCEVEIDDGETVRARLGVIATGGSQFVTKSLNLQPPRPDALISTTFGFYVDSTSANGFPFNAFNLRLERFVPGFHYATFFPVGDRTRVNVFTCWHPSSQEAKAFRASPLAELDRLFPHLEGLVGPFRLSDTMQVYTTHYYRQDCNHLKRTVLVGDEFQSVSPATGMGISKCLTDSLAVLRVARKLAGENDRNPDLHSFYNCDDKMRVDDSALRKWEWAVETATSRSLKTSLKMLKRRWTAYLKRNRS